MMKNNLIYLLNQKFEKSDGSRFRTFAKFVSFISIFLGTIALILSMSILDGFDKALKEKAISFTAHITIKSFHNNPIYDFHKAKQHILQNIPDIQSITAIIEREGLIKSKDFVDGVMVRGVNPDNDITNFKKFIKTGTFKFSKPTANEVILGQKLVEKMNISIGDNIILFALNQENNQISDPEVRKFKLVGIFESGMNQYDENIVMIPFVSAQTFFKIDSYSASTIEIMLKDVSRCSEITKKIDRLIKFPFYSISVFQEHAAIFSWIELQKEPIPLFLGIISIVAVLNIITTLLILVLEKTNSIGILKALGLESGKLRLIFIWNGFKIGAYATMCGAIISFIFSILQQSFGLIHLDGKIYFIGTLPIEIDIKNYIIVILITLLLSLLSTAIPAIISTKLNPLKTIRFK